MSVTVASQLRNSNVSDEAVIFEAGEDLQPGQTIYISLVDGRGYACASPGDFEYALCKIHQSLTQRTV